MPELYFVSFYFILFYFFQSAGVKCSWWGVNRISSGVGLAGSTSSVESV